MPRVSSFRLSVRMFVRISVDTVLVKVSQVMYVSESVHIWTILTLEG